MRFLIFSVVSMLAVLPLAAQASPDSGGILRADQACYDVQHYDLSLDVDPESKAIEGILIMTARATADTKAIALDLDGHLTAYSVSTGKTKLPFTHKSGRIAISFPQTLKKAEEFKVTVSYGGIPRVAPKPPWDAGFTWSRTRDGKPWISTTCQGSGADLWWPCKDHPSDKPSAMDLRITVPPDLFCASNGRLVSNKKVRGKRLFHWRISVPISNYSIALNIAPYTVIKKTYRSVTGEKVPAFFYALPSSEKRARKAFPHFLDHLRHMEEVCGPYPFRAEKYAVVETPHLGMEHQTIIAYGNRFRLDRDGYDWLHHHEMCHEWWANLVTCKDWKDMWIHEGIGTYMQALYMEKKRGNKGYQIEMLKSLRQIRNRQAVAPRDSQTALQIYRGHDVYTKGSWIMHTLRWLMEDEKFFVALRRMAYPDPAMEKVTDGSCVRLTDTEEIRAIAEKYHGSDLSWFFEVYLRQPALPEIVSRETPGKLTLSWKVPVDVSFPMPVPVKINGKIVRVAMPD